MADKFRLDGQHTLYNIDCIKNLCVVQQTNIYSINAYVFPNALLNAIIHMHIYGVCAEMS